MTVPIGVGGHGGTGIHADLQDKYGEILQRVAAHAEPTLAPCIHLTQVSAHKSSRHSGDGFPGMAAEYHLPPGRTLSAGSSLSGDRSLRNFGRSSEPSMDVLLSRISESGVTPPPPAAQAARAVPVAHVTKCTVCAIL